ncbi:TetR-like C-terminal domain-containing protein [Clostridium oryzae]
MHKWSYYFVAQGCCGILDQWMMNGMMESINDVVDFADKLIRNTLKQF